ncbi:homoserine kinase [Sphingomonas daechungensis]|uniref:homoserine kinase n=1 Tax=Sphingomonas daechungensis TaxID=1176646 RepID=UPI001CB90357|nr:homoserine kinase [Sphingomonas daechungensis]
MIRQAASASAPASIGNVGVGFDILGQAFEAAHDVVTAVRDERPGVHLVDVSGLVSSLPDDTASNTALAAADAVLKSVGSPCGLRLSIVKGVPLAAGMGGSAASAVAGAAAANAVLGEPYSLGELLPFVLEGERVASDPPHWDNVMASLLGGLVLAAREEPALIQRVPVPDGVTSIVLHPEVKIETRMARSILGSEVPLKVAVEHGRRVASFILGCSTNDFDLLRSGFEDVLVEPQRQHLLPCFNQVKAAALGSGALGCSFSGSGPSVFAWAVDADADAVENALSMAFADADVPARAYRAPVSSGGVKVTFSDEALAAA